MSKRRVPPFVALVIAGGVAVSLVLVIGIASVRRILDDADDSDCGGDPSESSFPLGSCAPPFEAADLRAGRVVMQFEVVPNATGGGQHVEYSYVNQTGELRSFDSRDVAVEVPDGRTIECAGDNSAYRFQAPPGVVKNNADCFSLPQPGDGLFTLRFDGAKVGTFAQADVPTGERTVDVEEDDLAQAVRSYSDAFLGGEASTAYGLLTARCRDRISADEFAEIVRAGAATYGDAVRTDYDAEISGDFARVTYHYTQAAIDQQDEPWARENGDWLNDDC